MRSRIGLALLAAVLSTAARAAVVEEFKAEDWNGLAFTSDETGQFTHCSVYASYRNGSTLYISYETSDTWFFSVANESWKLSEGGSFAIKFKVDRGGQIEGTGTALGTTQIGLPVEADHPFVGQLQRGNELVISFQNQDYSFELSNSHKAMNAAQDCVQRHVALGTHSPITTSKPEAQPQESQQAQQAPAEEPAQPETSAADTSGTSSTDADKPAQASGEQQIFGPWTVAATEDEKKSFVNCTAYDVQGDDQLILSYFSDNIWTFGLYRTAWKLDTSQSYDLWYNVDGPADAQGATKHPVDAAEPTRIFFELNDNNLIDRIENGGTLNVQLRGVTGPAESYSYSLDQAHAAFDATRKCVADHSSGGSEAAATADDGTRTNGQTNESGQSTADTGQTASPTESENTPPPLPSLGTTKVEDLDVAGWSAAAFSLDDGTFTHCAIKAEYKNGATLGFALTIGGELVVTVEHGDWSLTTDSWVPISFTLKGDPPYSTSGQGQAVDAKIVMTNIGGVDDLGGTLKSAPVVEVQVEGKDLSFDTSDIGPAFDAISQCVAKYASVPTASGPQPPDETDLAAAEAPASSPQENVGRRVALVIGNSHYDAVATLPNPVRDAAAIAAALRRVGFQDVTLLQDLSKGAMERALVDFADNVQDADWAVIYFAGHGLEMDGENYLVPVDAELKQDRHVKLETVSLDELLEAVGGAKVLQLVILDACRDNPFLKHMTRTVASRSVNRGLARIEPGGAELVVFAARDGQVALDGEGDNSPLVTALLQHLEDPGIEINLLFRKVRDSVMAATDGAQQPFTYGSLPGTELFFVPRH
jgi:hypothetical protein